MAQEEAQQLLERAVQKEVIRVVLCSSIQDLEKVRDMLSDNLMLTKDGPVQLRGKYGGLDVPQSEDEELSSELHDMVCFMIKSGLPFLVSEKSRKMYRVERFKLEIIPSR